MTNPSEGPGPADGLREALTRRGFSSEQTDVFMEFAEYQRELHAQQQERLEALQQRVEAQSAGGRARRAAPYVGTAAAAAAVASDQGQSVIGDVGRWTGDQAVALGQYVGSEATEAYNATVEGAQQFGQAAAEEYRATVESAQQLGQDISRNLTETYNSAVHGLQEAGSAISGWAVQTWGVATDAAHAVGAWGSQYADAVAADPGNHAATAALVTGAVVAATPQLRQAVGQAANATSRWAKAGFAAVRDVGQRAAQNVKQMYDAVRSDPRVQYALHSVGITPRQTHEAANEVTSIETKLPKTQEMVASTLANDPARPAPSTAIKVEQKPEAEAVSGAGEAANPTRTTNPSERGNGGIGSR